MPAPPTIEGMDDRMASSMSSTFSSSSASKSSSSSSSSSSLLMSSLPSSPASYGSPLPKTTSCTPASTHRPRVMIGRSPLPAPPPARDHRIGHGAFPVDLVGASEEGHFVVAAVTVERVHGVLLAAQDGPEEGQHHEHYPEDGE